MEAVQRLDVTLIALGGRGRQTVGFGGGVATSRRTTRAVIAVVIFGTTIVGSLAVGMARAVTGARVVVRVVGAVVLFWVFRGVGATTRMVRVVSDLAARIRQLFMDPSISNFSVVF